MERWMREEGFDDELFSESFISFKFFFNLKYKCWFSFDLNIDSNETENKRNKKNKGKAVPLTEKEKAEQAERV